MRGEVDGGSASCNRGRRNIWTNDENIESVETLKIDEETPSRTRSVGNMF